jgi:hypothetical protein
MFDIFYESRRIVTVLQACKQQALWINMPNDMERRCRSRKCLMLGHICIMDELSPLAWMQHLSESRFGAAPCDRHNRLTRPREVYARLFLPAALSDIPCSSCPCACCRHQKLNTKPDVISTSHTYTRSQAPYGRCVSSVARLS